MFTPPVSPLAAKYTTPRFWKCASKLVSLENSPPPQLIDTSPFLPPVVTWLVATSTAWNRSAKLLLAASTSMIFAFGAMACAHSISSAASCAQPQLVRGWVPLANICLKHPLAFVQEGSLNLEENTPRSFSAVA